MPCPHCGVIGSGFTVDLLVVKSGKMTFHPEGDPFVTLEDVERFISPKVCCSSCGEIRGDAKLVDNRIIIG